MVVPGLRWPGGPVPGSGDPALSGVVGPELGHLPVVLPYVLVHLVAIGRLGGLGSRGAGIMGGPRLFRLRFPRGLAHLAPFAAHDLSWLSPGSDPEPPRLL